MHMRTCVCAHAHTHTHTVQYIYPVFHNASQTITHVSLYLDEEALLICLPLEERGLLGLQLNPLESDRQLILQQE